MSEKQEIFTIMGGRVKMFHSTYNPTSDAVWVAAFVNTTPKTVLDVGTGTGAVALCIMARTPNVKITAIDISDTMLAIAEKNFTLNNQNAELINTDITTWKTDRTFDLVITNPPYFKGTPAHHNAHHNADLITWVKKCIARVRPGGEFVTIVNAPETANIIGEMTRHHCGDFRILPLFSTKNTAERVLVSARIGRQPTTLIYSGLSMNNDPVLRDGLSVADVLAKNT